jgi:hypothetical protein
MPMRTVRTIADVGDALRELYEFYDQFHSQDVDLHGKRFKNVGKHVDSTDFVRWDELPRPKPAPEQAIITKKGLGYDPITFGVGIGTPVVEGNDITPPRIVSVGSSTAIVGYISANQNPIGGTTTFDIWQNTDGNSILSSPIILSPNSPRTLLDFSSQLVLRSYVRKDQIRCMCLSTAPGFAGQDIEIVIGCKVNT